MKLSTRIALSVAAVVPLMVMASGALLLRLVTGDLRAQQDARLHDRAAAVAEDARRLLRVTATGRPPAVEQARQRSLFASGLDIGIRLTGPEGTASGGPQPDPAVRLPARAPVPVTVRGAGESWRVLSDPVKVPRQHVRGTLWLLAPDTASRTQLSLVRRRVIATALLAAPVSGLLAWAVAARAARPLRLLQRRTSGLDPRATATRLEHTPTRIAEVDDLAATLRTVLARYDEQAARTAEALETARSFSAAASHELRTPLMSMQTNLEVLAEHPDLGQRDREEAVRDLRREHARLLGLLVMLRELGRGDLVEADAFGPVEVADVIDTSAEDLRRRHPGARIGVRTEQSPRVHGWEPGLRTVVDNLLGNALVHGRTGEQPARVEVVLRASGRPGAAEAVLTVDDHGPGIPAQLRGSVFERFRRGPDSPGSGLGLTLVAQQVALHRGRIRVLERPGGSGTRIEVRLPALSGPGAATTATLPLRRDWMAAAARSYAGPQSGSHDFHKDGS
ncbi:sensor histidine kinase [Streptomyces meridianus]|uniref:histidine kinase n=1 Tax=Streptomyces meridianus TaxID=2938945 RepID=A0ABT0X5L3_9ACTN|nr:HAMP domain-containing sensor histidine kinase [Streptomyces meridianus]MCM2577828.1 HAMP domain-containing histidine kinase [Streptomyces meridianus]